MTKALGPPLAAAPVPAPPGLTWTDEQLAIINHPVGCHGIGLATAGSAKTTTSTAGLCAKRILVDRQDPATILLLAYNTDAAKQQNAAIGEALPKGKHPKARTLHSLGLAVIQEAMKLSYLPRQQMWIGKAEEHALRLRRKVLAELEGDGSIPLGAVTLKDAQEGVALFKNACIAPANAAHRSRPELVTVYQAFEAERTRNNALTFDDFCPTAIELLRRHPDLRERVLPGLKLIIVDEAQDLNRARATLVSLVAAGGADVLAIGDDDQTIATWTGARKDFFLDQFCKWFPGKPVCRYKLTRTFRFGRALASAAHALVANNRGRQAKALVAHDAARDTRVQVVAGFDPVDVNKTLADEVRNLIVAIGVSVRDIRVLGRCYSQLVGLALELMTRRLPFRIEGDESIARDPHVRAALTYVIVAAGLDRPVSREVGNQVMTIINKPNRYLTRKAVGAALDQARMSSHTLRQALRSLGGDSSIFGLGIQGLNDLLSLLDDLAKVVGEPGSAVFIWLSEQLDLDGQLDSYLGRDQASEERKQILRAFLAHAGTINDETALDFARRLLDGDTTLGRPDDEVLVLSTIHRTKGCEWRYVVIPDAVEGLFPVILDEDVGVYDAGDGYQLPPVDGLEAERSLAFVGFTRARDGLIIGAPDDGHRVRRSRFIDEAGLAVASEVAATLADPEAFIASVGSWSTHFEVVEVFIESYAVAHEAWSAEVVDEARTQLGAAKVRELEERERRAELESGAVGPERQLPPASWAELD